MGGDGDAAEVTTAEADAAVGAPQQDGIVVATLSQTRVIMMQAVLVQR